jgi:hypothetical protein
LETSDSGIATRRWPGSAPEEVRQAIAGAIAKERDAFPQPLMPYDCFSMVNVAVVPRCLSWYAAWIDFPSEEAEDADSVEFRQVQVKDYNVVLELSCCGPSLFSIRQNIHRVVLAFETLTNESGQRFIILLYDKNSHKVNRP